MPTPTYTPLANITLTGSASTVTFSSITQSYQDLILTVQESHSSGGLSMIWNNTNASGYRYGNLYGTTTTGSQSGNDSVLFVNGGGNPGANVQTMYEFTITDYAYGDRQQLMLTKTYSQTTAICWTVSKWDNFGPITTITLRGANFNAGSTFALYGLVA